MVSNLSRKATRVAIPHRNATLPVMNTPARIPTILTALCLTSTLSAQTSPIEGLDAFVNTAMKQWKVPGLALAIVKDDKVVYAKGYGVRDIRKPDPVNDETLFAIASNSKAFTCAALSILVQDGKLSWTDKVTDILPWFNLHDAMSTQDLRVEDLVVHRVGLPQFGGDHLWIGSTMKRRIRRVLSRKTLHSLPTKSHVATL